MPNALPDEKAQIKVTRVKKGFAFGRLIDLKEESRFRTDAPCDMDKAKTEAAEALANLDLPDNAKEPSISRYSMNSFPILALSVSSDKDDLQSLTKKVEDSLLTKLEGLEGVASVQLSGQQVEEVESARKPWRDMGRGIASAQQIRAGDLLPAFFI